MNDLPITIEHNPDLDLLDRRLESFTKEDGEIVRVAR